MTREPAAGVYWWTTVLDLPRPARDRPPASCDAVVVGGGYTGLSAALHLARAGASVAVLERESAGWGASSRNGGQVLTGLKLDPARLLDRFGRDRARQLFATSLDAIDLVERLVAEHRIECAFVRAGHLQAACKARHFDEFARQRDVLARDFDHHVALVPKADQHLELGSASYHGLLVDERSAALNPARYARGLADAAASAGALVTEGLGVTGVRRSGAGFMVETTGGQVRADQVLIATNGYTGAATPWLQRRLVPVGSYITATEPLAEDVCRRLIPRGRVVFDSKHFLHYYRLSADRRLLFGGRAHFRTATPRSTRAAAAILGRAMTSVFPELGRARLDYVWSGHVCFTVDLLPRFGRHDGVYFAAGYAGHGVAMATWLGRLAADAMLGRPAVNPFRDLAMPAIPLYRGRPWFLPLVGAYYAVRDWIE